MMLHHCFETNGREKKKVGEFRFGVRVGWLADMPILSVVSGRLAGLVEREKSGQRMIKKRKR
jgi:hypothetical protein